MASLDDVVDLIKSGDSEIIDKQEQANETLKSIDKNIMEFLGLQKKKRLDDLEDRREKKSRLGVGAGALAAGGAGLAAAGTLGKAVTGEGLGLGTLVQDLLKLYLGAKTIGLGFKAANATFKKYFGGDRDIDGRLKKLNADLDADLKSIDERLRAAEEDIKKRQADIAKAQDDLDRRKAKTVNRGADGRFEAEDPRTRAAEIEIKERQLREAQDAAAKAEAEKAQLEKARAEAEMRRAELEAVEQEKKKKKQLARIREMEAADAARLSEQDARAQGAEKAQRQRLRIEEMAAQDAAKTAEADARAQGAEKAQRQRLRIEEMAEQDKLRKAEADSRVQGAEKAQRQRLRIEEMAEQDRLRRIEADARIQGADTKLPRFMTEPGPGKIQQAPGQRAAGKVVGKLAGAALGAGLAAVDFGEGADRAAMEIAEEGKVATNIERTAGGLAGIVEGFVVLADAAVYAGKSAGRLVTGKTNEQVLDESFGENSLAAKAGRITRAESESAMRAAGIDERLISAEEERRRAGLTQFDKMSYLDQLASGLIAMPKGVTAFNYQMEAGKRIQALDPLADDFFDRSDELMSNPRRALRREAMDYYGSLPEVQAKMEELARLQAQSETYSERASNSTVVAPSSVKNDSRSFQTNVYQKGANNMDPAAYGAVPGFGPR